MQLYSSDSDASLGDYPPASFYFKVEFSGLPPDSDTSFQEVSGIGRDMKTEPYQEGGENGFVHRLPASVEYKQLVLKRGIAPKTSGLIIWCNGILEGGFAELIEPKTVTVSLMNVDAKGQTRAIRAWQVNNAYPVKWEVDSFDSTNNKVSIETIELSYNDFKRIEK